MTKSIELTFSQCKQLKANDYDLQEFITSIEDQPDFIKAGGAIDSISEIQAIQQGGCASGAYMPAVTYHTALEIMSEHGGDVFEYLDAVFGEVPAPKKDDSWASMACFYLSCAIETWCTQFDLEGVDWN